MSPHDQLIEVSNDFEQKLRAASSQFCSVKIGQPFEDVITRKLQHLTLLNSKLKLLNAKPIASTPQVTNEPKTEATIREYGELATWKVLEQRILKSLTHTHSVKSLVMTPDRDLDQDMTERKEKIIQSLSEYRVKETELRQLDAVYIEKQEELEDLQRQWDRELTELREIRERADPVEDVENMGPLYMTLRKYIDKLELIRWMISRLVVARGAGAGRTATLGAAAPHSALLSTLAITRTVHSVDMFTAD